MRLPGPPSPAEAHLNGNDGMAARSTLAWCAIMHFLNDGLVTALTVLLPLLTADLGLSYAEAGAVKTAQTLTLSLTQLPASWLAGALGEATVLGLGLAWFGAGFVLLAAAGGYLALLLFMGAGGIGGGVYHPVGTAMISSAYGAGKRGTAIGTLNFSGDLGKMAAPLAIGLAAAAWGWRTGTLLAGAVTVVFGVLFLVRFRAQVRWRRDALRRVSGAARGPWLVDARQFWTISAIGCIDQGTRSAIVAFLGILLFQQGASTEQLAWLLTVTMAGGAVGKFVCGFLSDHWPDRGVIALTEGLTAAGCGMLALTPLGVWLLPFLFGFGVALNGTSSVIYSRLADALRPERFSVGYAVYFTLSFAASALAPFFYGLLADATSLYAMFWAVAAGVLLVLPLLALLRRQRGSEVAK